MKKNQMVGVLKGLGLTENEANVYISSLGIGPGTVIKIARSAEMKRSTVYSVIESLQQKGLMTIEVKGFKKYYAAEDPAKLERIWENRKQDLRSLLGEFSALYNLKGGESFIKYYQGLEAIKSVYEGLLRDLKPHDFYLVVEDIARWYELDQNFFKKFIERRAKLNIEARLLLQDSPAAREHKKFERNYRVTDKILPQEMMLTTSLIVTPQRVVIHQLTPPILAIVIENKSVIQMHREMFEIMWRAT